MPNSRLELGELWRQVSREMHERIKDAFKEIAFSPMKHTLLHHMHKQPGVTVNQLARDSGTVKSHVSKLVDQLASEGVVEKRPDPTDQRLVRLYLTPLAEERRAEAQRRLESAWLNAIDTLDDAELEVAVLGLRTMLTALQRTRPAPVPESAHAKKNGDETW